MSERWCWSVPKRNGAGKCVSFTERSVFRWGPTRGDFWITIRPFDRNLYGKKTDGVFGIKEVRESRALGAYGCVSVRASPSAPHVFPSPLANCPNRPPKTGGRTSLDLMATWNDGTSLNPVKRFRFHSLVVVPSSDAWFVNFIAQSSERCWDDSVEILFHSITYGKAY